MLRSGLGSDHCRQVNSITHTDFFRPIVQQARLFTGKDSKFGSINYSYMRQVLLLCGLLLSGSFFAQFKFTIAAGYAAPMYQG